MTASTSPQDKFVVLEDGARDGTIRLKRNPPSQSSVREPHLDLSQDLSTTQISVKDVAYALLDPSTDTLDLVTVSREGSDVQSPSKIIKYRLEDPSYRQLLGTLRDQIVEASPSSRTTDERPYVEIVVNEQAGHQLASLYLDTVILPLLEPFFPRVDIDYTSSQTHAAQDGERIGRQIGEKVERDARETVVVVLGGDGTVHEVLNGAFLRRDGSLRQLDLDIVVIPCGTANALYYHLFPPESPTYPTDTALSPFYSVVSFVRRYAAPPSDSRRRKPPSSLPLALNALIPPLSLSTDKRRPSSPATPTLTSVVSSAALHACLLHDAEQLRATVPGLERFKLAAQENVKRWWDGKVRLVGPKVDKYDPKRKAFIEARGTRVDARSCRGEGRADVDDRPDDDVVEVEGPFAYFVSALVSRFEPSFVVAPHRSPLSPLAPQSHVSGPGGSQDEPSIDLVVIRPLRHLPTKEAVETAWRTSRSRSIRQGAGRRDDSEPDDEDEDAEANARMRFRDQVWGVTAGMYDGGRHVDLVYPTGEGVDDGDDLGADRDGSTAIVEVYRCREFEWVPDPNATDLKSHLVCLDGALHDLGQGGRLSTRVLGHEDLGQLRVYA
ncbi:hypothetical protein JCM10212_001947 [Sporobolomyces blumeae]